ncbi:hypothetical protein ACPOL_4237 [Acidisarcina polymorpha]|uniref:Uncharacterized protein n=1 Tax=Acidisarcina polymorpha TaxID=2211140 RepID=A0A2Z5G314_9BACT|nr:hypothetical protein ACPOL_4237 [Acidisarcina polymorpha]
MLCLDRRRPLAIEVDALVVVVIRPDPEAGNQMRELVGGCLAID